MKFLELENNESLEFLERVGFLEDYPDSMRYFNELHCFCNKIFNLGRGIFFSRGRYLGLSISLKILARYAFDWRLGDILGLRYISSDQKYGSLVLRRGIGNITRKRAAGEDMLGRMKIRCRDYYVLQPRRLKINNENHRICFEYS